VSRNQKMVLAALGLAVVVVFGCMGGYLLTYLRPGFPSEGSPPVQRIDTPTASAADTPPAPTSPADAPTDVSEPTATLMPTLEPTATETAEPSATPTTMQPPTAAPPSGTPLPDFVLPGAREKYQFDEIVALLSSPELVSMFMENNISYDQKWDDAAGGNEYVPAWTVYERGSDDCDGHSILQCYILERNGWDA